MNSIQVELACGCVPKRKMSTKNMQPDMYCLYHGWQPVRKKWLQEWHLRCMFETCNYSRWFGQNEKAAKRAKSKHNAAHPAHLATVAYDRVTPDGKGSTFRDMKGVRKKHLQPQYDPDTLFTNTETEPPF